MPRNQNGRKVESHNMIHISKVNLTGNFQLSMEGQNVIQIMNAGSTPATLTAIDEVNGEQSEIVLEKGSTYQPNDGMTIEE